MYDESQQVTYVKTITPNLLASLPKGPYILAVWFMDDGSIRNDAFAGRIATPSFTPQEHELLQAYFRDEYSFSVNTPWHIKAKNQKCISIPAATFRRFTEYIMPIVQEVPSFLYKVTQKVESVQVNQLDDPLTTEEQVSDQEIEP